MANVSSMAPCFFPKLRSFRRTIPKAKNRVARLCSNLEKDGIREYKTLVKDSAGYYHGMLKPLVILMIRDSEKHVELLKFLRQTLTR